jgi:hypothetical protein
MEGIRTYQEAIAEEMLSPLSNVSSRTVYTIEMAVTLLYMMSGLNLLDILLGIPGGAFQIGINLFLVYYLKQFKSWARVGVLIRAGAGIVANFFILGLHNATGMQLQGLKIVFLIYAIFPLILGAILLQSDVKWAFQSREMNEIK